MASDIWLKTILIVRKETRCRHIGYSFRLTARVLIYAPSHRQDSTYHGLCYTSRGALAGTRNIPREMPECNIELLLVTCRPIIISLFVEHCRKQTGNRRCFQCGWDFTKEQSHQTSGCVRWVQCLIYIVVHITASLNHTHSSIYIFIGLFNLSSFVIYLCTVFMHF